MERTEAAELLPIIKAYAAGKVIEQYHSGRWVEHDHFAFDCGAENYRIKPEPLEFWCILWEDNRIAEITPRETQAQAEREIETDSCKGRVIHVREITDET